MRRRIARIRVFALVLALLLASSVRQAGAVVMDGAAAPSSAFVNATTSYTFTGHTQQRNERLMTTVFTFPANTDVSGVSAATVTGQDVTNGVPIPILGVVADTTAGTVTITTNYRRNQTSTDFSFTVGGVMNASKPGSYSYSVSVTTNQNTGTVTGTYSLTANTTAVTVRAVTPTPNADLAPASYTVPITLGPQGRLAGTTVTGANTISLTFPVGYTLPASAPASSVTIDGVAAGGVAISGDTLTITLPAGMTLAGGTTATIVLDATVGIVNPAAGTYSLTVRTDAEAGSGASPSFPIALVPYLAISIDTTSVDFGVVQPGQTYGPNPVNVGVTSNLPVTLIRALTGDFALMGLTVSGAADGPKPAGSSSYTDQCALDVPWSTDPDVPLNVTISYTVVQ